MVQRSAASPSDVFTKIHVSVASIGRIVRARVSAAYVVMHLRYNVESPRLSIAKNNDDSLGTVFEYFIIFYVLGVDKKVTNFPDSPVDARCIITAAGASLSFRSVASEVAIKIARTR